MQEMTYQIGKYGLIRKQYLQTHRKGLFAILLTSGKLHAHLTEIDQTANDRMELITRQTAECEGVNEQLKAESQMLWVQKMNNIRNRAEESIFHELIYC
jgi:hypothetical protein